MSDLGMGQVASTSISASTQLAIELLRILTRVTGVAFRFSGTAAAKIITSLWRHGQLKSGHKRLFKNMVRREPVTALEIPKKDLSLFNKSAKKMGIQFLTWDVEKRNPDGNINIICPINALPGINQILEKNQIDGLIHDVVIESQNPKLENSLIPEKTDVANPEYLKYLTLAQEMKMDFSPAIYRTMKDAPLTEEQDATLSKKPNVLLGKYKLQPDRSLSSYPNNKLEAYFGIAYLYGRIQTDPLEQSIQNHERTQHVGLRPAQEIRVDHAAAQRIENPLSDLQIENTKSYLKQAGIEMDKTEIQKLAQEPIRPDHVIELQNPPQTFQGHTLRETYTLQQTPQTELEFYTAKVYQYVPETQEISQNFVRSREVLIEEERLPGDDRPTFGDPSAEKNLSDLTMSLNNADLSSASKSLTHVSGNQLEQLLENAEQSGQTVRLDDVLSAANQDISVLAAQSAKPDLAPENIPEIKIDHA